MAMRVPGFMVWMKAMSCWLRKDWLSMGVLRRSMRRTLMGPLGGAGE